MLTAILILVAVSVVFSGICAVSVGLVCWTLRKPTPKPAKQPARRPEASVRWHVVTKSERRGS